MKRRGFLMGLLAAPIAGVATKEIIERVAVNTPDKFTALITNMDIGSVNELVNWEEIVAEPVPFDPNKHHRASDIEGFDELAARIEEVRRDMIWNKQKQVIAGWYPRGSA